MNSHKLLATVCGGALILAACVNSPTSADLTPIASTAIDASATPVAPASTVVTSSESDEASGATTLVGSSSTVVEAQGRGEVGSTTTLVALSDDGEAASTTVTPFEARTVDDVDPADSDPEVSDPVFVPLDLPIGTCFDDPQDDVEMVTPDDIPIVDCDVPHANEVFGNSEVEGEEFPGNASVHLQADSVCYESFENYVGVTYESSIYDFSWYFPTAESWPLGGTSIICFAYHADLTDMSGSISGTGR